MRAGVQTLYRAPLFPLGNQWFTRSHNRRYKSDVTLSPPWETADTPSAPTEATANGKANMKIRFKLNDSEITATLVDSKTSRDFVSLLPLTLTMNDLFGREKFAHLPRAISTEGKRTHTYEAGDIAYWSPGPDVAIYYKHDGEKIPGHYCNRQIGFRRGGFQCGRLCKVQDRADA
jgi:hypothetical protein